MQWKMILVGVFLYACIGCAGREVVQVVDPAGKPVEGANVEGISLSMNTAPSVTDARGETTVPENVQGAKWVQVSKLGFERVQVDVTGKWPLRVTLVPVAK